MRHLVAACCFCIVCCSGPYYLATGTQCARAETEPKDTEIIVASSEPKVRTVTQAELVRRRGQQGLWFPLTTAKKLLKDLRRGRGAIKLNKKLELRLETAFSESDLLQRQLQSTMQELQIWKETAEVRTKEMEALASPPWYKRPHTLAILGFFLGAGSAALIVWSVQK